VEINKSSQPNSKNSLSDRSPKSNLRIGLVSPDLCQHPVSSFIEPLLANYDHEGLEIYAYSDVKKPDSITAVLSQLVDKWCDSSSFDNQILAKQIQSDAIDILIDLAGHTAWNRMEVFAMKPAPIQATYLGYPSTTGLPTMDFRLTDEHADPVGNTEAFHTEKLIRLPDCAWCYKPHRSAPPVHPLPALENGFVTFGCFNNMAKWNAPLYELWANILQQVPNSHLRLKAKTLIDVAVRDELIAFFSDRVIDSARLEFSPHTQKIADHFAEYHKVDIALDSFPYHGTTTTCESMWMGVPVITLAGKSHVSRVGVSLLNAVSLPELIAQNPEEYIQKAVELSGNPEKLSTLRAGFRDRMTASVLTNAPLFAKRMGEIFISMSAVSPK
jgi:predicted O-linked N-acetylglucosamine transferase (SPINDLY family)